MEDNSQSDEEIKDEPMSPKLCGKKLKLNDGSSQDSLNEGASGSKDVKEENVDSGVSADKSESTSSEDRGTTSNAEPTNEVVNIATSSSNNVRTILVNLRRPRHSRIYRKRKTPNNDSDESSSRDSDDLSHDEEADNIQLINTFYDSGDSSHNSSSSISSISNSAEGSNEIYSDDHPLTLVSDDDTDSDETLWNEFDQNSTRTRPKRGPTRRPSVLLKTRPKHDYLILREVINREMGLTFPRGKANQENVTFEKKFYGSLHAVYRMSKFNFLAKHKGCVNSINFHPEGHLLASGSDDTNVVVWDWARNIPLQTIKTGHKSNVFQSKFLYLNAQTQLNIVTCARDGQVRLIQCPASGGGGASRRKLATHSRAAHKVHVSAHEPHLVISAGEDAVVMRCDVRVEAASKLLTVRGTHLVPLYSVAGHPLIPHELLVAGRDMFVRVYDTRKPDKPLNMYTANFDKSPDHVAYKSMLHLTCAVYNHDGSEILGSYNDEDIYLFDTKLDVYDKDTADLNKQTYTHKYSGHRNSATFKGVSFFGPQSQFVVSGSDCSHIFIWEKHSEALVQMMEGDKNGVVNCIEAHPRFPIIASSGLDKDVKLWMPQKHSEPDFKMMEKVVRANAITDTRSMFTDFLPTLYSAWRGTLADSDEAPPFGANVDFDGNACTTF
ncbi:unnamed protein product [Leptosia nina]|uniref:DDB1- and CUL4-associated factor 8 n=1 Tax=Leptosia nina TaxID=320188 RepID=A0AAV1IVP7_9NEOP